MSTNPDARNETAAAFGFDNSYARLPERFYAKVAPSPAKAPELVRLNRPLAETLGLDADAFAGDEGAAVFAGDRVPADAEPLAMAYAGHQFGQFVPQLGDGRAVLLGEIVGADGVRYDIQLKGSGRTPFSRGGDGRAVLEYVLREYVAGEAMAALGVPTTRALAAAKTGERVIREDIEPGAVIARVARSLVRVGTFQYFAARSDVEAVKTLLDYVIARLYPDLAGADNTALALFERVSACTAELIADWMALGFIHGVMNTDNMSVAGETIDFGPWAFMDAYHPETVFSAIDRHGRYAFAQQPRIGLWNMARFAETLLPLIDADQDKAIEAAQGVLERFTPAFTACYERALVRKIGLDPDDAEAPALARDLLSAMADNKADYTLTFRRLAGVLDADIRDKADEGAANGPAALFNEPGAFENWAARWRPRVTASPQALRAVNPLFVPRNHWVQYAADRAKAGDLAPLDGLLAAVTDPYSDRPDQARFAAPPTPEQKIAHTFCGT